MADRRKPYHASYECHKFLVANRSVKNPPRATKSRMQTIASTPQTDSTVLQQQVTA